jgi:medium-chain acyl-[acyl-carrier-protein] hydrolase
MRSPDTTDKWVERRVGKAPARFRLFCFPYAGGSAAIFRDWADEMALNLEVCAIQLPGRERRHGEPALRRSDQAVEILVPILRPYLDMPFVMFGHSMGAVLAYEVTRGILTAATMEPRALVVSAHHAPQLPSRKRNLHDLPRDQLLAEVRALNGTPAEVFEHEDLVELVLPMLRSDLELVESYTEPAGPVLSCPVIAIGGTGDPDILPEDLAAWRSVTAGPFKSMLFQGDHFFINSARASFLRTMRQEFALLGLG